MDLRIHLLDTSALVKLFIDEDGSPKVREYFGQHSVFHTTQFCFAEALGVFKAKMSRREIEQEKYLSILSEFVATIRDENIFIVDAQTPSREAFNKSEALLQKYPKIDFVDAAQLVTLVTGFYTLVSGDSKPILISADEKLVEAARSEGVRAWYCMTEESP